MKRIELSQGHFAIVDDEDYEHLIQHNWYSRKTKNTIYAVANMNKTTVQMHRFIMKPERNFMVDHKNRNGLDNRRENLRICTRSKNLMNSKKPGGKLTSKYKGVCYQKQSPGHLKCWKAEIRLNGKSIFLGYFYSEIEAAKAYNIAAVKYFGDFSNINEIV